MVNPPSPSSCPPQHQFSPILLVENVDVLKQITPMKNQKLPVRVGVLCSNKSGYLEMIHQLNQDGKAMKLPRMASGFESTLVLL